MSLTLEATNYLGLELAAQALTYLCEMTDLFPPAVRVDLLGGIFSTYQSNLVSPEFC
jgi:hypothetical protein